MSSGFRQRGELFQMAAELHLLRQYPNNPLIGYLNVNSVCNKIADLQIIIQNIPLDYLPCSK